MGSLVKTPKMPEPDPELVAMQKKQEERLASEEERRLREVYAQRQARTRGGMRMLLSPSRETPQTGVRQTLGASSASNA